jgi:hypothetical protein
MYKGSGCLMLWNLLSHFIIFFLESAVRPTEYVLSFPPWCSVSGVRMVRWIPTRPYFKLLLRWAVAVGLPPDIRQSNVPTWNATVIGTSPIKSRLIERVKPAATVFDLCLTRVQKVSYSYLSRETFILKIWFGSPVRIRSSASK